MPDDAEIINTCIAARCLTAWYDLVERSGRFLTNSQRVELHGLGMRLVLTLERLALLALVSGHSRWRLQRKVHAFIHINEDHLWFGYNCRFVHCYLDEDNIGLTKRLAQKVLRGGLMELRILCRWLLRLGSWMPGRA